MNTWKSNRMLPRVTMIVLCGLMSFAYQNCAKARFSIDPAAKSEALGKEGALDGGVRDGGDDANSPGSKNPPGDDSSIPGGKTPPGNDASTPNVPINLVFECSNKHSDSAGGNILTTAALKIVIVDKSNKVVCDLSGDFKSSILNTKKVAFTPCAGLPAGSYEAYIMDAAAPSSSFLMKALTQDEIKFVKNADGSYNVLTKKVEILYDFNKSNSQYADLNKRYGGTSTDASQQLCDTRASPLIVSMNSESRGIRLTSPLDGIQFDILGEKSFPVAHAKKQISWLADQQEYYFIVLPNKNGQVLGVNEMFGDNTRGPDGKFAANGYAALAKYDDDKDGLISEDDEIYSELRLWNDANRDGIADANELFTLKEKGVSVIDLHYDKRYKETDQYGNQTLMKSVIKTEDGKLHLVFDLWFRYLNITK